MTGQERTTSPGNGCGMKAIRTIGAILIPIASLCLFCALMARIDSQEELRAVRAMDVVIGLMFAASFALAREPKPVPGRVTVGVALLIWLLASGPLLLWHEFQMYARSTAAEHGITRGRIVQAYQALIRYSQDCGEFPAETQGLKVLRENPGSMRWKGPYTPGERSLCDCWGRPLLYRLHTKRPVIWSCGKDGINGTSDDITVSEDAIVFESSGASD